MFDSGKGAKTDHDNETYYVGNKKLLAENNIAIAENYKTKSRRMGKQSKTVIWFANSKQALAVIAIADKIKETSVTGYPEMREMGIDLYMLTGDNEATAKAIAGANWHQTLQNRSLPQHKADFVKELQSKGK